MMGSSGTVSSFVGNIHTDIVACISTSGTVSSSTLYSPYGEKIAGNGTSTNPIGYQSDYTDPLTGLIDMGVRNYDPALSRFMTTDPADPAVTDPESFNPYLYTDDAPLGRTDVTGQWWNPVKSAVGLGKKILNTGKKVVAPVVNHVVKPVVRATKAVGRKAVSAARWGIRTAKSAIGQYVRGLKKVGGFAALPLKIPWAEAKLLCRGADPVQFAKEFFNPTKLRSNFNHGMEMLPAWGQTLVKNTLMVGTIGLGLIAGGEIVAGGLGILSAGGAGMGALLATEAGAVSVAGGSLVGALSVSGGLTLAATGTAVIASILDKDLMYRANGRGAGRDYSTETMSNERAKYTENRVTNRTPSPSPGRNQGPDQLRRLLENMKKWPSGANLSTRSKALYATMKIAQAALETSPVWYQFLPGSEQQNRGTTPSENTPPGNAALRKP